MKTTSTAIRKHLDGDVTALCTCWKIIRKDGKVLCFTDADVDLTIDAETYLSVGAYTRTAIESTATLSVDNLDVEGIAANIVLPIDELRAGAFDHAEVFIFLTPWISPSFGTVKLRKGFFGEVRVLPNGTFDVELRGLLQKLAHNYMEVFSATCRNDLGDSRCRVDLYHPFSTEGAHIPMPILDSDFEELGQYGLTRSFAWYDPNTSGDIFTTTSPTRGGSYAARGSATGFLQQDISLTDMGEEFMQHVRSNLVDVRLRAWRRDLNASGRITVQFFDALRRNVRQSGYYRCGASPMALPSPMSLSGDFTVEFWIRANTAGAIGQRILTGAYSDDGTRRFTFGQGTTETTQRNLEIRQSLTTFGTVTQTDVIEDYTDYDDGNWHHISLVRRGAVFEIYKDGALLAEVSESSAFVGRPITIEYFGGSSSSDGIEADWDEIRVWDVARQPWQVAADRFYDFPDSTPALIVYYPFEIDTSNEGLNVFGAIAPLVGGGFIESSDAPVSATHRGSDSLITTGFQNLGDSWQLVTVQGGIPSCARSMQLRFEGVAGAGPATGALLDSVFGTFVDGSGTTQMPNLDETGTHWNRAGMVLTGGNSRIFRAAITEPRAVDGWFNGGLVTFYTGRNAGGSMEVKTWYNETGQVELFLSMPHLIEPGDLFTIYPGCDKSRVCCSVFFNNIENMFATPDVPGEDELFRYPDAK